MSLANYEWLPHLKGSIPEEAYGDKIDMYVVAFEGWRRGLDLTFTSVGKKNLVRFKLSDGSKEHSFSVTRGDRITNEAINICIDKDLTKRYLKKAGVPVPAGKKFDASNTNEEILEYASSLCFPLVIKPLDGKRGRGVISNINNNEFLEALTYIRETLGYKKIIIEEHFTGEEYRVYVVNGQVHGVIKRIPANVIGDGNHTIKELISIKNEKRKTVPNLKERPIKIDKEVINHIERNKYTLETVLEDQAQLFLRQKGNLSTGGDSVDYTDDISDVAKDIAVRASKAIPNLDQCGVDILFDTNTNHGVVIEINSRAGAGGHLFPLYGKARDIPAAIIDYYFPETTPPTNQTGLYFDYKAYWDIIKSGKAKEVRVRNHPSYKISSKHYEITGKLKEKPFMQKVYRKATSSGLYGNLQKNKKNKYSLIIAGKKQELEEFEKYLETAVGKKDKNYKIITEVWEKPIRMGFDLLVEDKAYNIKTRSSNQTEKKNEEIERLRQRIKDLELENKTIKSSKSWRYSSPLRNISRFIKK
ncbi:ATP-grasp domain-containing protein [Virgibacillus halodenitrificans]|uniref:ATP-grasp domain-containing protein n=1 Tax=Virgibacillus halodenitrificans TaxID=1482 RepID=UPI0002E3D8CE|nr:ATP-grasp domain-containing protein [Virgibacillus halodenitrificans]